MDFGSAGKSVAVARHTVLISKVANYNNYLTKLLGLVDKLLVSVDRMPILVDIVLIPVDIVPDHASRICDVVLVRRIFSSGNPRGSGIWDGEGMGRGWKWGDQFTSNLGPRWTGTYHTKEGFQVSKREWKGSKRESARGSKKARGLRHVVSLYICT